MDRFPDPRFPNGPESGLFDGTKGRAVDYTLWSHADPPSGEVLAHRLLYPSYMFGHPLLFPALALSLGIWIAGNASVDAAAMAAMALLCFELARRCPTHAVQGARAVGLGGWVLLGAAAMAWSAPPPPGEHPLDPLCGGRPTLISGRVVGPPILHPDGWEAVTELDHPSARVRLQGRGSPPPPGARIQARVRLTRTDNHNTPGQRDRSGQRRRSAACWTAHPTPPEALTISLQEPGATTVVRRAVRRFLTQRLEEPVNGLALALLLGDRSALEPALRDCFMRCGTAHLLAISGLHVGIIALMLGWLGRGFACRQAWLRERLAPLHVGILVGLAGACAYGALTGWSISTRRAVVMAAAVSVVILSRRKTDPLQICAAAWIALLLADPAALWEPGTALSFSSVVALLRLPILRSRGLPAALIAASAAATLGTGPVTLLFFGRLPLLSIPANLVAIPVLGGLLVPLLFVSVAVGLLWPPAGTLLLAFADTVARAGCATLEILGHADSPAIEASPPPLLAAVALAVVATALALRRPRLRWLGAIAGVAVALLPIHPARPPSGELALTVLDVGHGDSCLVTFPTGETLLVDAGGTVGNWDPGGRLVVPALRRMGVRQLEMAAVTHLHVDHHGGMAAVLTDVGARQLWLPVPVPPGHPAAALLHTATHNHIPFGAISDGAPFPGRIGDVRTQVLHPRPGRPCPGPQPDCPPNHHSLVLRLQYADVTFLLTGDAEAPLEEALLARRQPLRAQVLKVPHHGSNTSSTQAFVDVVQPAVAIASLDPENRHQFPRPSVRHRYTRAGAEFLATGVQGTIQVATDGHRIRVRTYRLPWGWTRWETVADSVHGKGTGGDGDGASTPPLDPLRSQP